MNAISFPVPSFALILLATATAGYLTFLKETPPSSVPSTTHLSPSGLTRENAPTRWQELSAQSGSAEDGSNLDHFLHAWGHLDGETALAAIDDAHFDSTTQVRLKAITLDGYVSQDSEAALSWFEQQKEDDVQLPLGCGLIRGMVRVDVRLATEYVRATWDDSLSPNFVRVIARDQLACGGPVNATSWAKSIHNEVMRRTALSQIEELTSNQNGSFSNNL